MANEETIANAVVSVGVERTSGERTGPGGNNSNKYLKEIRDILKNQERIAKKTQKLQQSGLLGGESKSGGILGTIGSVLGTAGGALTTGGLGAAGAIGSGLLVGGSTDVAGDIEAVRALVDNKEKILLINKKTKELIDVQESRIKGEEFFVNANRNLSDTVEELLDDYDLIKNVVKISKEDLMKIGNEHVRQKMFQEEITKRDEETLNAKVKQVELLNGINESLQEQARSLIRGRLKIGSDPFMTDSIRSGRDPQYNFSKLLLEDRQKRSTIDLSTIKVRKIS